jgi:SAM-dependent methyltransferase
MAEEHLTLTSALDQLAELDNYNQWIFEQFSGYLGRRILEVGSGTGNITAFLCQSGCEVLATDIVPAYRRQLQRNFEDRSNVRVGIFDLTKSAPSETVENPFDTVVCLNVLEHIEDDAFALNQINRALLHGGILALLVPAHRLLYGKFDSAVGHFRRYERKELSQKLIAAGFSIEAMNFFSIAATLPWLINGRILKRPFLPTGQTRLANSLVPLFKLERFIGPPFGLSLIAIARKK